MSATTVPRGGKLKGIASPGPKRASSPPELPTAIEQGLPAGFRVSKRYSLWARSGTPRPILDAIHRIVSEGINARQIALLRNEAPIRDAQCALSAGIVPALPLNTPNWVEQRRRWEGLNTGFNAFPAVALRQNPTLADYLPIFPMPLSCGTVAWADVCPCSSSR
jgi:hypothetical protein